MVPKYFSRLLADSKGIKIIYNRDLVNLTASLIMTLDMSYKMMQQEIHEENLQCILDKNQP